MACALIKARTRAGLTQAELATRMKTTQSAIARLESGRTPPSTRTLEEGRASNGDSSADPVRQHPVSCPYRPNGRYRTLPYAILICK